MATQEDPPAQQWEKLFPRDIPGRIALALTGLLFAPISGSVLVAMLLGPGGQNADRWVRFIAVEVALTFFTFSITALIWAIATPRWLESALPRVTRNVVLALGIGFIPVAIAGLWALFLV